MQELERDGEQEYGEQEYGEPMAEGHFKKIYGSIFIT